MASVHGGIVVYGRVVETEVDVVVGVVVVELDDVDDDVVDEVEMLEDDVEVVESVVVVLGRGVVVVKHTINFPELCIYSL